jgi:transposase
MEKEGLLYNRPSNTIFLYDLTNTYFEGAALNNNLAAFGKCKSKRYDCRLVTLALVVDTKGFPIMSQIYSGNQSEPETFGDILERIRSDLTGAQISLINPTIVMDRGIATDRNIELILENGYEYIVIERKDMTKEFHDEFKNAKEEFEVIKSNNSCYGEINNVYAKKISSEKDVCHILCLSEGKEKKEVAIEHKKEVRFLEDVDRLQKSIKKGSIKKNEVIYKRIGRVKERHSKVSNNYIFETQQDDKGKINNIILAKKVCDEKKDKKNYGCYVIESTHTELEAKEIWNLYMTLTKVENSFRALKSALGLRPIYHQNEERTKGHLFISVLAYHLLNAVEVELEKNNDHRSWTTICKELSTHQRSTVVMSSDSGSVYHLRLSGNPEFEHLKIYEQLGVKDHLKRINKLAKSGL